MGLKEYCFYLLIALMCMIIPLMLLGCSQKVVYKEVKVPIKCDIEIPKKPSITNDFLIDLKNLIVYSEVLEKDLNFCVKGEND